MNFLIPKTASDMLLYIWKIIGLPSTPINDLLYTLSFELFLFPPDNAINFINKALTSKHLVKNESGDLKLSQDLEQKIETWQSERKDTIISKILEATQSTLQKDEINIENGTGFNVLLKAFLDKGTINRAATVSNSALSIDDFNPKKGTIKVSVAGKKEDSYYIDIDVNKKTIRHNCHDFQTRRAQNKKFCKHIVKLFLILKDKNEKDTEYFLNEIAENISDWMFSV